MSDTEHEKGGLDDRHASITSHHIPVDQSDKSFWERLWPVIACGAGLFSDGYLNAVCESCLRVWTLFSRVLDHRSRQYDAQEDLQR
jgi:hypothetical protein